MPHDKGLSAGASKAEREAYDRKTAEEEEELGNRDFNAPNPDDQMPPQPEMGMFKAAGSEVPADIAPVMAMLSKTSAADADEVQVRTVLGDMSALRGKTAMEMVSVLTKNDQLRQRLIEKLAQEQDRGMEATLYDTL